MMVGVDIVDQTRAKRPAIRRGLLRWYSRCARDLPWRRTSDPYRIWLSEIMLQQTRVETVVPYYLRFLDAFDSVDALAAASIDEVLKLWEGLGYYRRARSLHEAAKLIASERNGRFPRTVEQWMQLPGVGRYTAGAIASIAFGAAAAVLDGNVKRVLARLTALDKPIDAPAVVADLWAAAEALVTAYRPGDFNQAMMELGARICTPRSPLCKECPVRRSCNAFARGRQGELPLAKARRATPHHEIVAAAIVSRGRYLLGRRPVDAMLGGLWEFPGGKVEPGETHAAALEREITEELGVECSVGALLGSVDHAYSHFSITLHLYRCEIVAGPPAAQWHTQIKWIRREQFDRYAFPGANRKLFAACQL